MPKYILTDNTRGIDGILVKGVLGDYVATSFTPSKIVTSSPTSKSSGSGEGPQTPSTPAPNTPSDNRVVSTNSDALKNFDSTKIYEGLVSYNKEDKTLYVWKGETDENGKYVWEKVASETEETDEPTPNTPQDSRFVTEDEDALKNFDSTKIYEGLITYNQADKTLYVWKGETDENGKYVWEQVDTVADSSDVEELTEEQMDDLFGELQKNFPSDTSDEPSIL